MDCFFDVLLSPSSIFFLLSLQFACGKNVEKLFFTGTLAMQAKEGMVGVT